MPKMIITKMIGSCSRKQPPLSFSALFGNAQYSDSFTGPDGGSPDPAKWTNISGSAPTIQGNAMQLSSGPGSTKGVVENATVLSGDFDVQVDFEIIVAPGVADWAVDLIAVIDDTHQILSRYQGLTRYWTQGYINGGSWTWNVISAPTLTVGKLRIIRVGSTLSTYYWTAAMGWLEVSSGRAVGSGNCKISLRADTWTNNPVVTWRADNFVINFGMVAGICDGAYHEMSCGIEEFESENKPEAFEIPVGARISQYNGEWEHWVKQGNPDDFPGPDTTFCTDQMQERWGALRQIAGNFPKLLGGWLSSFGYSNVGRGGGDPAVLYTTNYDMAIADTSASMYDPALVSSGRGPGDFNPPDQGVCYIGGERMHYGSLSTSGISALAREFGYPGVGGEFWGPWMGSSIHYGHDYEANPTPPPTQIVARKHDAIGVWYPPRWINHWTASGRHQETRLPAPVGYAPKGAKCGVFMPIILRFLAFRRRHSKNSSLRVVIIKPTIS